MTCHVGQGIVVCTGSPWRPALDVECPWCLEKRRCLCSEVHGGWCAPDFICGTCGSFWNAEQERPIKMTEAERDENVALAASIPDPTCWICHDTGYEPMSPIAAEAERCAAGCEVSK